jgi:hypothetical protein
MKICCCDGNSTDIDFNRSQHKTKGKHHDYGRISFAGLIVLALVAVVLLLA